MKAMNKCFYSGCLTAALILSPSIAAAENSLLMKPYLELGPGIYLLNSDVQALGSAKTKMVGGFVAAGIDLDWGSPLLLGVQLRVSGSGKDTTTLSDGSTMKSRVKIPLWSAYFVPRLEVTDDWRVHALLGATKTPDYTVNSATNTFTQSNVKTSFSYGVGMDYRVFESFRIGAEWTRYHDRVSASSTVDATLSSVNLTLSYTFGDDNAAEVVVEKFVEETVRNDALIIESVPEPVKEVKAQVVVEAKPVVVAEPTAIEKKSVVIENEPVVASVVTVVESELKLVVSIGNIRKEPNLNSEILYRLKKGATVKRLSVENEWSHVRLNNGSEGWAHQSLF